MAIGTALPVSPWQTAKYRVKRSCLCVGSPASGLINIKFFVASGC